MAETKIIELTVTVGAKSRSVQFNPRKIPMSFMEDMEDAQETGKYKPMLRAVQTLLGLTDAERRSLTQEDIDNLFVAVKEASEANKIPNE